jgi:hypothetical protein
MHKQLEDVGSATHQSSTQHEDGQTLFTAKEGNFNFTYQSVNGKTEDHEPKWV